MTLASATAPLEESVDRPTRSPRLLGVTWLQHRGMLLALAGLLIVIAVVAILIEMQSHAQYAQFVANHCVSNPRHSPCGTISDWFSVSTDGLSALEIAVSAIPVIVGVFVGAPLLSREFETGTFRFTFTQRVGRNRFVLITLAIFAVVVAAVGVAAGLLLGWVVHPFEVVGLDHKWQSGFFNATAVMLAGWSVFALALGAWLGACFKRVVSSMAATAVLVGGLIIASAKASLYNLFGSKEELVAAYLESRHEATSDRLTRAVDKFDDSREKILAVFDSQAKLFKTPDFRGCAFVAASTEAPPGGLVENAADDFRGWIRAMFVDLAKEAGAKDPLTLGRQLHLIYDGAALAARMDHGDHSISKSTREAVQTLLDAAIIGASGYSVGNQM